MEKLQLTVALSYGGRAEIVDAVEDWFGTPRRANCSLRISMNRRFNNTCIRGSARS